jgi:hypothetical protein
MNSLSPASPQYLCLQASKVARGPLVHSVSNSDGNGSNNKSSSNKEKFLSSSSRPSHLTAAGSGGGPGGGPGVVVGNSFTPKSNRRKPKLLNSEAERFVRRTERKQRIQTLVKKFQINAQHNAEKRGAVAVVVKEKFSIPSFIPKLDSTQLPSDMKILKPSQMFENSIDGSSVDSSSSSSMMMMLKEEGEGEEEDDLFEEMSVTERGGARGEGGGGAGGLPPIESVFLPQKYSMLERIINKEAEDQVITQLTLRMGGEPINVVVYWLPKEECLRLNAFCFQGSPSPPALPCPLSDPASPLPLCRSEEYTFTINQSAIEHIFHGVPHLQAAHMQSPYLLHNLVERMKIERMRRKDALAVMMKLNKIPNDKVAAKLARDGGLDTASVESILSGTPLLSAMGGNSSGGHGNLSEEEDRVRVITLRSMTTNGTLLPSFPPLTPYPALVMCCIAKVRNSHWEQLLKAVPKIEHRSHSIEEFLSKPVPKKVAGRHSVY